MSWQNTLICWSLRRNFLPETRKPVDVARVRTLTSRRVWTPPPPRGWRLREQYACPEAPLRGEWLVRERRAEAGHATRTILYLHGGGYYFCSPRTHRAIAFGLAKRTDADCFSLAYRLAPEHPFPAAHDDALAAYRRLLAEGVPASSIVIAGDSAGGGLALATLVALRDAGDALPAGAILFSPWTDLAATGASIRDNDGRDPMFCGDVFARIAPLYLGTTDAAHPYVSPLYADLHGLPPLSLYAGSTETLLDDTRRVAERARAAGVSVDCEIAPNLPHIWPIYAPFLPEARRTLDDAARFVRRVSAASEPGAGGVALSSAVQSPEIQSSVRSIAS
ncbi:alpha/beta hydrolase [Paraburkholderia acidisoli]|uniref:Alpha/beta hydrolase fold domain-containing protein n=1 Tax=Paraburkholderia acidisoli TaxID=2571748 RepID=A0A7Z2GEW1_9BURK|nr:alpha/beta hydrolase [Paraburkholderia acidisoli]QGZ60537.1 alpha/beta hydrolase fold domain-containing protein [Paraburkholderia acidisoli]